MAVADFDTELPEVSLKGRSRSEQTRLRLIAWRDWVSYRSIRVGIGLGTQTSALLLQVYIAIDRFYMDFVPAAGDAAPAIDILPGGALG